MDGVVSPATAIDHRSAGRRRRAQPRGAVDPLRRPRAAARARSPRSTPTRPPCGCRRSTPSRSRRSWSAQRIAEIKEAGVTSCASVTPQRTVPARRRPSSTAELDLLVIQGTVVSAEHVSKTVEPLNLKRFIRELEIPVIVGGCASYQAALHLMRTGAVGILVGVGPGHACTTRGRPRPRRPAGHRHRRRRRRPHAPPRRDRRLRPRHRRRRDEHRRRHRQGHRLRRRRRDDRLARWPRPTRRPAGATTGAWPPSTPRCPGAPG